MASPSALSLPPRGWFRPWQIPAKSPPPCKGAPFIWFEHVSCPLTLPTPAPSYVAKQSSDVSLAACLAGVFARDSLKPCFPCSVATTEHGFTIHQPDATYWHLSCRHSMNLVINSFSNVALALSACFIDTFALSFCRQLYCSALHGFAVGRVQELLLQSQPDPSMAGALPPGAWWEAKPQSSNGNQPPQVCLLTFCFYTAYLRAVCK